VIQWGFVSSTGKVSGDCSELPRTDPSSDVKTGAGKNEKGQLAGSEKPRSYSSTQHPAEQWNLLQEAEILSGA